MESRCGNLCLALHHFGVNVRRHLLVRWIRIAVQKDRLLIIFCTLLIHTNSTIHAGSV